MRVSLLKCKLHRCTVTHADVSYEGSITISEDLLEAAGMLEYERADVWNVTTGSRFTTYAMVGPRDSGVVCVNGAAARLVSPGDIVIVACFAEVDESEAAGWRPRLVFVDPSNRLQPQRSVELAGPSTLLADEPAAA